MTTENAKVQNPRVHIIQIYNKSGNGILATVAYKQIEDQEPATFARFVCGVAVVNPIDRFNRRVGRQIAEGRLRSRNAPTISIEQATAQRLTQLEISAHILDELCELDIFPNRTSFYEGLDYTLEKLRVRAAVCFDFTEVNVKNATLYAPAGAASA